MSRLLVLGDGSDNPPDSCFQSDEFGTMPTCTYIDGTWHTSYDEVGGSDGSGTAGVFVLLFVVVLAAGIGAAVWRVRTAQRMARGSGMDEGDATAMALLTDNGLESTYLAANLRSPAVSPAPPAAPVTGAAARLQELRHLRDQELITAEEYEARRTAIIDSV